MLDLLICFPEEVTPLASFSPAFPRVVRSPIDLLSGRIIWDWLEDDPDERLDLWQRLWVWMRSRLMRLILSKRGWCVADKAQNVQYSHWMWALSVFVVECPVILVADLLCLDRWWSLESETLVKNRVPDLASLITRWITVNCQGVSPALISGIDESGEGIGDTWFLVAEM